MGVGGEGEGQLWSPLLGTWGIVFKDAPVKRPSWHSRPPSTHALSASGLALRDGAEVRLCQVQAKAPNGLQILSVLS